MRELVRQPARGLAIAVGVLIPLCACGFGSPAHGQTKNHGSPVAFNPSTATPSAGAGPAVTAHASPSASPAPGSSPASSAPPAESTPPPANAPPPATSHSIRKGGINTEPGMRPWRYSGANPDGWWCVVPNCYQNADPMVTVNTELTLASRLNVANVRLEFPWPLIEPQRGVYDWARADAIVAAARTHRVTLQPVLLYSPGWAAPSTTAAPASADWSAFVTAVVQRYPNAFPVIELWNEPDGAHYWSSGDQAYVQSILIPGYAAIKAVNSNVMVMMAGPACATCGFIDSIYQYGGGNSFDIASYHDYGDDPVAAAYFTHNSLVNHGQGNKPIWLSEYGVQENTTSDSQQQSLINLGLTEAGYPVLAQWYTLRDDNSMSCCPPAVAVSAYWGLMQHDDATRKAGFGVMQALLGGSG